MSQIKEEGDGAMNWEPLNPDTFRFISQSIQYNRER